MSLPNFLKPYFWDVETKNIEPKRYRKFVLERILEEGNLKSIRWAEKTYPKKAFIKTLINSKILTPKSANFWANIFNLDKKRILCLKKSSTKKQKKIWPY